MRHVIPKNVSNDGGIMGGAIKKRNAAEAAIYIVICLLFFRTALFFLPLFPKVIVFFIVAILPGGIMLIGINDQSAIEFFTTKIRYMRRQDIVPYVFQTDNPEEEPRTLVDKFSKRKKRKEKKKEDRQRQYKRELEFIANDASSSKRQAKRARKKLEKEAKIQREEEARLLKIQKKKEAKAAKRQAKAAEKEAQKDAKNNKRKRGKR